MIVATPPDPIWEDDYTHMSVHVVGGLVELRLASACQRLTPHSAAELAPALSSALAEAAAWADRWDIVTGCYGEVS